MRYGKRARLKILGAALTVALVMAASAAAPSSAKTIEPKKYAGVYPSATIDGAGSVGAPAFGLNGSYDLAMDQVTGSLYVSSPTHGVIYKFGPTGAPQSFSALAPDTVLDEDTDVTGDIFVDNSATSTSGRIYALHYKSFVSAFDPSGAPAVGFPVAGQPLGCGGDVGPDGNYWISLGQGAGVIQHDPQGTPTGNSVPVPNSCEIAIDSQENVYAYVSNATVQKFNQDGEFEYSLDHEAPGLVPNVAVDRSNDHVFVHRGTYILEYDASGEVVSKFGEAEGAYPGLGGGAGEGSYAGGVVVRESDHSVFAVTAGGSRIDRFAPSGAPVVVPDVVTGPAKPTGSTAVLTATVNADDVPTTDCRFEWGTNRLYNSPPLTCTEGNVFTGGDHHAVTAPVSGLTVGDTYHFRVTAENANGVLVTGKDREFVAQGLPQLGDEFASKVKTSGAQINATIDPAGGDTRFRVELGTTTSYGDIQPVGGAPIVGPRLESHQVSWELTGLTPNTEYHYRVVATNDAGTVKSGSDHTFRTFSLTSTTVDTCPNALARQQTGAAMLLSCRAYELVSAPDTQGYDVESTVVPGQDPFVASAEADGRALYGIHEGGLSGVGSPTNKGVDPYLAVRGADGWSTSYVGIPADGTPSAAPFGSPLEGSDQALDTFVFGGPGLCDPCFGDGSSGAPIRRGSQGLSQGLVGSMPVPDPNSSGGVRKPLSADGRHFVFSSLQRFESAGNASGSDVTIYDRNLETGTTQVVSTLPNGLTIEAGSGVVALDVSADGSRILIGRLVSTDAAGNQYFDLFMHQGSSANSIPVADTPAGVLFAGMTSDGGQVLFTTRDALADDSDTSIDLFRYVLGSGSTERVSSGDGAGDSDSCDPAGNSQNPKDWNVVPGELDDCSVVAIGGGDGVAASSGIAYFLSPEALDGSGDPGAPNLFRAAPGGAPKFVATLESSAAKPLPTAIPQLDRELGPFVRPVGAAIDAVDGSMYVYDVGSAGTWGGPGAYVQKFDSAGGPIASYGVNSKNDGTGSGQAFQGLGDHTMFDSIIAEEAFGAPAVDESLPTQIAVDNQPSSPSYGSLYVLSTNEFSGFFVRKFDRLGNYVSSIEVGGEGSIQFPGAVAVDQSSGKLYVGVIDFIGGHRVNVYTPTGSFLSSFAVSGYPLGIAVDGPADKVYVATETKTATYKASDGSSLGVFDPDPAKGVAVDLAEGRAYVDKGDHVTAHIGATTVDFGMSELSESVNLVSDGGRFVVSNAGDHNALFGDTVTPPGRGYDSPLVIDSVADSAKDEAAEFQTTPSGEHSVFRTGLPLIGYDSDERFEVYRYDAAGPGLTCVSCPLTNSRATGDSELASHGLSVTGDGRVFFNTPDALVLRDTNSVKDVYEWAGGRAELISTGLSKFDSALLSANSGGRDVLFFTRDRLASEDLNGSTVRLYDARENGGRFHVPVPPQCAASDECHGPGSTPAAKADIASLAGRGGNVPGKKVRRCRKGFVKRGGKCVKKAKRKAKRRASKGSRNHG